MRRKPKGEPKIVKGLKEYQCLICLKTISKGDKHVFFSFRSPYLTKAWKVLTKFQPWTKKGETFIGLRFCSGRCYRFWRRIYRNDWEHYPTIQKRLHQLEVEALKRRSPNWKTWTLWQEILNPFQGRIERDEKEN